MSGLYVYPYGDCRRYVTLTPDATDEDVDAYIAAMVRARDYAVGATRISLADRLVPAFKRGCARAHIECENPDGSLFFGGVPIQVKACEVREVCTPFFVGDAWTIGVGNILLWPKEPKGN